MALIFRAVFDGDTVKDVISGKTLTVSNILYSNGLVGRLLKLTSNTGYLEFTNMSFPESLTVSLWAYFNSTPDNQDLFYFNSASMNGPGVYLRNGGIHWNIGDGVSNPFKNGGTNVLIPLTGMWQHMVFIVDKANNKVDMYLNGQYYGTLAYRSPYQINRLFTLLNYIPGYRTYALTSGVINDVRIYDTVFTPSEVQKLYEEIVVKPEGLIFKPVNNRLCLTINPADVPFADVKSILVYEPTNNLVVEYGWSTTGTKTLSFPVPPPVTPVIGSYVPTGDWNQLMRISNTFTLPNNATLCISGWFYVKESTGRFNCNAYIDGTNTGLGHRIGTNGWNYLEWTYTNTSGAAQNIQHVRVEATTSQYWPNNNNELWGCNYQVEIFNRQNLQPTSFVNGARVLNGTFIVPSTNIPVDNFLISMWFKMRSSLKGLTYPRIIDRTQNTTSISTGFGVWLDTVDSKLKLQYGTTVVNSNDTIDTYNALDKWLYLFFGYVYNANVKLARIYIATIDGNVILNVTDTNPPQIPLDAQSYDIIIGNNSTFQRQNNMLFANLFIGRFYNNTTRIWTEDIIQKVYNSRKPLVL